MDTFKRFTFGLLATAIILLAVVLWGLRLAMANIDYFKSEIEYLLTGDESPQIIFTGLRGDMNRFNPVLRIENLSLTLPDRSQPLFVDQLAVEFDFWASLRQWAPVVQEVSGQLEKVELIRDLDGRWWADQYEIGAGAGDTTVSDLTRGLAFVPRYLKLQLNRLVIDDQINDVSHRLDRVSAQILYQRDRFLLTLSTALPDALGRGILIKSVIGDERSLVYLNTSNLQLHPVAELFGIDTWGLRDGALDGELWFNLERFRPVAINGDIVLKNGLFQAAADKATLALSYRSRFNAVRRNDNWDISNKMERLNIDGRNYRGFHAQIRVAGEARQHRISALVNRLQIPALGGIAEQLLPEAIGKPLRAGQLRGRIENFALSIDPGNPSDLRLRTHLVGLQSVVSGKIPGVSNLDANLLVGGRRARVRLQGSQVGLDFADQFRAPIALDQVDVDALVEWRDSGFVVAADRVSATNPDIRLDGRLWLEADPHGVPFVYMRADFADASGSNARKYLPVKILPPKALAWLDRGIVEGRVPRGEFQFHGRLRDIRKLERARAGEFFVDFEVEDAEVFFAPGWLPAKNASGRVLFHNVGMDIELDQVSYDRVDNARARASIAEFARGELVLAIKADAAAATAVDTWLQTPVGSDFREPVANLHDLQGRIRSEIDINLLLSGRREPEVRVALDIQDAAAQSRAWGLDLAAINGALRVENKSIRGSQLGMLFYGEPVTVDVAPEADTPRTLLQARGRLSSRNLLQRLPQNLRPLIEGRSDWELRLSFAGRERPAAEAVLRLNATSDLVGTQLSFPSPFAKAAQTPARVSADLDFYPDRIESRAKLGEGLDARGRFLVKSSDAVQLDWLQLAFATEPKPVSGPGLHLSGYLPRVSLEDWRATLAAAGGASPTLLQSADLVIDEVQAFGRALTSVTLDVTQTPRGFAGKIDSAQVKGRFEALTGSTVTLELEHLRIDRPEQSSDFSALRPASIGDLQLSSKTLEYHGMRFTDLKLATSLRDSTLTLDNISLQRDQVRLAGTGTWRYDPYTEAHGSTLSMTVQGKQFGEAMNGLGFGNAVRGGKIDFAATLGWPGPLPGFDLEKVNADATLKLEDGVLNNVEPGSGRFVGLLSLSALPRRLSLDFSDVLIKGMEFDSITGTYRLEQGVLLTRNTKMEGPAADIRITGKTGIIDRSYDQEMRVTPNIRQTLPVIGAVTAGSSVGWGLLLLQNLFKKTIDNAVEVEYRISGSWDDPKIELIKAVDENQAELPTIDR